MKSGIASTRLIFAWAVLGLSGCASTRYEAPPEVVPQPPVITTDQAIAAGLDAELQAATDAAAPAELAPVPAPAPTMAAAAAAARAQRRRPTALTVEEIRAQSAGVRPPLDFQQRLDQAHDRTYTWMQGVVEATDHRFADKDRQLTPIPAAPFRLGVMTENIDRSGKMDFNLDVNLDIALSLPNIEKRLRIFVTSDGLDEGPRSARESSSLRAGLRYGLGRFFDFDVGVRVDVPPVAFASIKWAREYQLGDWDFYPFAKIFAETKESVGYAAATTFDRWSGRNLVRSSTYAKWREDRNRTEWSQTFIYARAHELLVPERYGSYPRANDIGRGWGLRLLASGVDTSEVTYYEAGVFYARPTANHWLFWSVEPLVNWDRNYGWKADPGIKLGVNALFWDLARPAR